MTSVYAQILGAEGLVALAPECRVLHESMGRFEGEITVEMTRNPFLRLALRCAGFPKAFEQAPLSFTKEKQGQREVWIRQIGDQVMRTVQWVEDGDMLAERLGAMTAISRLSPASGGLDLTEWQFRFAGLAVPRWAAPNVMASERPDQGLYRFEIAICLPWSDKPIVRYHGWLATS
ncbi:DUF4166 domain-containing protein [Roseovarius phycicola]|uniref:DUF4166 domain-containing protein n=1 Tax=Roseovarius phycicola TaxID=3080976 RepID=A0ABZ2HM86_9RHOB